MKKKKEHINTYIEYMTTSLDNFGGYNYVKEMFFNWIKVECLLPKFVKYNKQIYKYYKSNL